MPLDNTQPQIVMVPVARLQQMQADQAKVQELSAQSPLGCNGRNHTAQAAIGQVESWLAPIALKSRRAKRAATIAAKAELTAALAKQPLVPHGVDQLNGNSVQTLPQPRIQRVALPCCREITETLNCTSKLGSLIRISPTSEVTDNKRRPR